MKSHCVKVATMPRTGPVILCSKRIIRTSDIKGVEIPRHVESDAGTGQGASYEGASYKGEGKNRLEEHGDGRISCCDTKEGKVVSSRRRRGKKRRTSDEDGGDRRFIYRYQAV